MTPETARGAVPRLLVPLPSGDGRRDSRAMADVLRLAVPDLVGLSLVVRDGDGGPSWTLAATGDDVALLDAVQYLTGGPEPVRTREGAGWLDLRDPVAAVRGDGLAGAAASVGVGAVLVVAGAAAAVVVRVYAGSCGSAAEGQVDRIATALAAWAQRADDLRAARVATLASRPPEQGSLHQQGALARAVACVALRQGLDVITAQDRLRDAARRAGVPEHDLARLLVRPAGRPAARR